MPKRNSLIGFTIKAILAVIGLALVWTFIAPYYNRLLVTVTDWSLTSYRLSGEAGDIFFHNLAGEPVTGIHGAALHFGLILLLALIIATPGLKILHRLRNTGVGLIVMFVFHLITLVLIASLTQSNSSVSSPSLSLPIVLLSTIGLNLIPPLVWIVLCWRRFQQRYYNSRYGEDYRLNTLMAPIVVITNPATTPMTPRYADNPPEITPSPS